MPWLALGASVAYALCLRGGDRAVVSNANTQRAENLSEGGVLFGRALCLHPLLGVEYVMIPLCLAQ